MRGGVWGDWSLGERGCFSRTDPHLGWVRTVMQPLWATHWQERERPISSGPFLPFLLKFVLRGCINFSKNK